MVAFVIFGLVSIYALFMTWYLYRTSQESLEMFKSDQMDKMLTKGDLKPTAPDQAHKNPSPSAPEKGNHTPHASAPTEDSHDRPQKYEELDDIDPPSYKDLFK